MTQEALYKGQIHSDGTFRELLTACQRAGMFSHALILVERFPAYVITDIKERRNLLCFTRSAPDTDILWVTAYTSGRIFNAHMELRWDKNENEIQVVYVGVSEYGSIVRDYGVEEATLEMRRPEEPEKKETVRIDQLVRKKKQYFLFGERLRPEDVKRIGPPAKPGDFAEARIPRLLRYAPPDNSEQVLDGKYMQLHACEYWDDVGNVVLYRFVGLEAVEG